ncbi:hypothetical protein SDC9_139647 [bioreactor metagenome]|uniref:Uncharacterized protein n=1 Tax=bioreactor metagenome TaxID=1076179 RepID=A0A645DVZ3_9ZZZZ
MQQGVGRIGLVEEHRQDRAEPVGQPDGLRNVFPPLFVHQFADFENDVRQFQIIFHLEHRGPGQPERLHIRREVVADQLQHHLARFGRIRVFQQVGGPLRNHQHVSPRQHDIAVVKLKKDASLQADYNQQIAGEIVFVPVVADPHFVFHAKRKHREKQVRRHIPDPTVMGTVTLRRSERPGVLVFRLPERAAASDF